MYNVINVSVYIIKNSDCLKLWTPHFVSDPDESSPSFPTTRSSGRPSCSEPGSLDDHPETMLWIGQNSIGFGSSYVLMTQSNIIKYLCTICDLLRNCGFCMKLGEQSSGLQLGMLRTLGRDHRDSGLLPMPQIKNSWSNHMPDWSLNETIKQCEGHEAHLVPNDMIIWKWQKINQFQLSISFNCHISLYGPSQNSLRRHVEIFVFSWLQDNSCVSAEVHTIHGLDFVCTFQTVTGGWFVKLSN